MKTRQKGIIFFAVVAGIMLASGITIAIPGKEAEDNDLEVFVVGDGYTDEERPQFCGTNDKAKSTDFVQNLRYPQRALNLLQSQLIPPVQFGLRKQTLVILQNLIH